MPILENYVEQYKGAPGAEEAFDSKVQGWIKNGWFRPFRGKHEGVLPLMAVIQVNKPKVRPVLDYRELNQYVSTHTGASVVCVDKL